MRKKRIGMCALGGFMLAVLLSSWAMAQPRGPQGPRGPMGPPDTEQDMPQPPDGQGPLPLPDGQEPPPPIDPRLDATPEEIAEFCITQATEMADRAVLGNQKTSDRGVAIVTQLLENGQVEDALCVARWSIFWVNHKSGQCIADVRLLSKRCVRAIIRAGGTQELVDEVRAACQEQIARIVDSRNAAIEAIKAVLPELPEPEEAPPV